MVDNRGGWNKDFVNSRFFKEWTSEMSYVLGFLYADGCLIEHKSSRAQYIQFGSSDLEIIRLIKRLLDSDHKIQKRSSKNIKHRNGVYRSKKFFRLRIGCKEMFKDLINIGLTTKKSKKLQYPDVPEKFESNFIRGYFDGDGSVFENTQRNRLNVVFTSGDKNFLNKVSSRISFFCDVSLKNIHNSSNAFNLQYSTQDGIEIFKFLYKKYPKELFLQRKFKKFIDFFNKNKKWKDKEVVDIITKLK